MPVFTINDLESLSSFFHGKMGNALGEALMKLLCVNDINKLYDNNKSLSGPDFTTAVLKELDVNYTVRHSEVIENLKDRNFITVSNHPYGGIDGLILVDFFGHIRTDYKVIVNKVLGRIKPLNDSFINVIPTGKKRSIPKNDSIQGIRSVVGHVNSGHPIGIFPSGAISDFNMFRFRVEDRKWQEPVIRLVKKLHVPVLPVKFLGINSALFYALGLIDWRVRLMKLPSELFNKKGKDIELILGDIITPEEIDVYSTPEELGEFLRESVYKLK